MINQQVLSGRRVLIVEDEPLVAMLLEDLLGEIGCTSFKSVGTAEAAFAAIAEQQFDLAVLDVGLRDDTSYGVADRLAEGGVPFVFSTGYSAAELPKAFEGRPVLPKPFLTEQLEIAVKRSLNPDISLAK